MAKITGIGLGPGDPELITVKGLNILRSCDAIVYPAPPDKPSFVREIAARWLDDMAPKIEIVMPIPLTLPAHVSQQNHNAPYERAADDIMPLLDAGKHVAILCEGDPFLYGSFVYIFETLSKKFAGIDNPHDMEIIPGISCLMAASAQMQRPLAIQNEPLLALPALSIDESFEQRLEEFPALAIIKIGARFGALKTMLTRLGLIDQSCYIEYATSAKEKILPLADTDFECAPYFSMVLIRKNSRIIKPVS